MNLPWVQRELDQGGGTQDSEVRGCQDADDRGIDTRQTSDAKARRDARNHSLDADFIVSARCDDTLARCTWTSDSWRCSSMREGSPFEVLFTFVKLGLTSLGV